MRMLVLTAGFALIALEVAGALFATPAALLAAVLPIGMKSALSEEPSSAPSRR
jgi:hypothetical protein